MRTKLRARLQAATTLALGLVLAQPLAAQARLDGVLIDSTRTLAPLAGAEVVLLADGRRATTDRRGRFRFENVPAGPQRVAYGALWLDSVGVPVAVQAVDVPARGRVQVTLATASVVALQRLYCGTALAADVGLLTGEVRDADNGGWASGVRLEARWREKHLGPGVLEDMTVATTDTTNASGRYVLCGVPLNVAMTVTARHPDGRATETLVVETATRLGAADLMIGTGRRTMVVSGRVVGPAGQPLPRANVVTSLEAERPLQTDSTGRFRFVVPARSGQVYVRTLGYQPEVATFAPAGDEVSVGDISLRPVGAVLDTRIITARPRTREEADFLRRKSLGMGVAYLDSTDLALLPRITASMVAHMSRGGVRAVAVRLPAQGTNSNPPLPFQALAVRGVRGYCMPPAWVDGLRWGSIDVFDQYGLLQRAKRIEIYRAPFVPIEFFDNNDCGALVVWTR